MHVHAHAGTRVHEETSLTGLVPERVQLTVHTTEPTGTVPEPFHCDHIARWSARSGTSGRSGTGLHTGNWNGSGTVLVSNLWCEHGLRVSITRITTIFQMVLLLRSPDGIQNTMQLHLTCPTITIFRTCRFMPLIPRCKLIIVHPLFGLSTCIAVVASYIYMMTSITFG